jgi:outer membrane receptor protein involved in Fe transport
VNGDGIQQHDSRLQEGANSQWLHPLKLFGQRALFTAGANFHDNQINVGLYPRVGRNPIGVTSRSNLHVTNSAGYFSQAIDLWQGRLHLDAGLRYDYFWFKDEDKIVPSVSGVQGESRFQPKGNIAYTPSQRIPFTLHLNYGRGISSQDARGVVQQPSAPKVSTTDFYQIGTSYNWKRFSLSNDVFFIDRSNEQVYIPDDGSFEFKVPPDLTVTKPKLPSSGIAT